jgi:two-component system phosphate regulon sensor histidine kinase PhoR
MKRLWNSNLVTKVFLSYLAVIALLFLGLYYSSNALLRNFYIDSLSARMEQEAHLLARVVPFDLAGVTLDTVCRQLAGELGSRITVIAADGRVLGDSAEVSAQMENHANRPEVIDAMRSGTGSATRYSTTVRYNMLYRAFHQTGAGQERIVRVAVPLTDIDNVIDSFRRSLLAGLAVAAAAGLVLAWLFSRRLSRRFQRLVQFSGQVAGGSFPQNFFPDHGKDEITLVEQHLNEMSFKIRDNLQQVIAEKEKADSILRCMIEGVLVLDPRGRVLVMNEQALSMFHVPAGKNVHGVSILEISRHPEVHRILEEVLTFDFSAQLYSKQIELDDDRWFRVNAVRLRDNRGDFLGSILVFHDTTDIKRFESMRSDFVANVSHELRTPLTVITGYLETLLDSDDVALDRWRQPLRGMQQQSSRMLHIIEDLLMLTRLESPKERSPHRPVAVPELLADIAEDALALSGEQGHRIEMNVEPQLWLMGCEKELRSAFSNLVFNAVRYTPAEGQIEIRWFADDSGLHLAVKDNGEGIAPQHLPRLTERFYRVNRDRSRGSGGTGLGLSIVKHVVNHHGGQLRIASELGVGSLFTCDFPWELRSPPVNAPANKPSLTLYPNSSPASGRGE